jgi:hypothetical protein
MKTLFKTPPTFTRPVPSFLQLYELSVEFVGHRLRGNLVVRESEVCVMGNKVDFKKCESLDRRHQELTEPEREQLEELLRAAASRSGHEE